MLRTEVERALAEAFAPFPTVLLAVSGGGDSMAMLHAAACVLAPARLRVATVDHGLRPEAEAEARFVHERAQSLGIDHATLRWQPEGAVSAARARDARYDLLTAHARKVGAGALATAHTLDDQAETVWMRAKRLTPTSGTRGLAGIPERATHEGLSLLRPLLGLRRAHLRSLLHAAGERWHEDPTNSDPARERTRARSALSGATLPAQAIARLAHLCARHRAWQDARTAAALENGLSRSEGSLVLRLPADRDERTVLDCLSVLAMAAGGVRHRPRLAVLRPLLAGWRAGEAHRVAVGGALLSTRRGVFEATPERRGGAPGRPLTPAAAFQRYRPASEDAIHAVLAPLGS